MKGAWGKRRRQVSGAEKGHGELGWESGLVDPTIFASSAAGFEEWKEDLG